MHVGAFVLGTAAFLALASFLLVTIMKSILPSEQDAAPAGAGEEDAATTAKPGAPKLPRPPRKRRAPTPAAPSPSSEDE